VRMQLRLRRKRRRKGVGRNEYIYTDVCMKGSLDSEEQGAGARSNHSSSSGTG
jgi:hypothetical protein